MRARQATNKLRETKKTAKQFRKYNDVQIMQNKTTQ